jgi:hypothetical protein
MNETGLSFLNQYLDVKAKQIRGEECEKVAQEIAHLQ